MRARRSPAVPPVTSLIIAVTIAVQSTASAQIVMIPGPTVPIARSPEHIALGDFDGDGDSEIAILSAASDQLSVMDASANGALVERLRTDFGRRMEGVAVRDVDNDGNQDIAVADESGGAPPGDLLVLRGRGNASFDVPEDAFTMAISAIEAFAMGELDGVNGPDAVMVTGTRSDISIMLNDGDAASFTALPLIELSRDPRDVETATFDDSGRDSIVILNTNADRDDEIVVLRYDGLDFVQPDVPRLVGGADAVDFAIGDFNRDGWNDIAVLHEQVDRTFTISTLTNLTDASGERPVGTATFAGPSPLTFDCPADADGDRISCRLLALAAGDFDRDGSTDLAVAMDRPEAILFLNGLGGGSFGVGPRVDLEAGAEPAAVRAGDVTGNGAADLVVGDTSNDRVLVIRSVVPIQQPDGTACTSGNQCESTICLHDVCCGDLVCPSGQRCDVPGSEGRCTPLAANGTSCFSDTNCASGFCTDGVCCAVLRCGTAEACNVPGSEGTCAQAPPTPTATASPTTTPFPTRTPTPQPLGRSCSSASQCQSNLCEDQVCCNESCPEGRFCNISGAAGTCNPRKFVGQPCSRDSDCLTNQCLGQLCSPAATATASAIPTRPPTATPTPRGIGGACDETDPTRQCDVGFCTDFVCCDEASCSLGDRCDIFGSEGECQAPLEPGSRCEKDSDCAGDVRCVFLAGIGAVCEGAATPTPGGPTCPGDCNRDRSVTVDEILVMIEIALGTQPAANCLPGDNSGDGQISVDEILVAVAGALEGCPAEPMATATATASPTASATASPTPASTAPAPPTSTATATTVPTEVPAATATETPTTVPTATPTIVATAVPTATPTRTPTTAPTATGTPLSAATATPTDAQPPTATPTVVAPDLTVFDEFAFSREPGLGFCPSAHAVFAAEIRRAGSFYILEMTELVEGTRGQDTCLDDIVGPSDCLTEVSVSPVPTVLTESEVARMKEVFSATELSQVADPSCEALQPDPCLISGARWDERQASDFPCRTQNRLTAAALSGLVTFLEELRTTRSPGDGSSQAP